VADAYNGANSFPNMIYELLLGGLLSSLFIPMLMRARLRGRQYTQVFTQRVLAAGISSGSWSPNRRGHCPFPVSLAVRRRAPPA